AYAVVLGALEEDRQVLGDDAPKVAGRGLPRDVRDGSARAHARPRCNERSADRGRVIAAAWVVAVASVASGRDTAGPWAVMALADSSSPTAAAGSAQWTRALAIDRRARRRR